MTGEDPIAVEQISEMVAKIARKLELSIDGFNDVVTNPKNKRSLEDTLEGASLLIDNMKQGRGTLGKLLTDDSIFEDLQSFTADLKVNPWKLLYRPPLKRIAP